MLKIRNNALTHNSMPLVSHCCEPRKSFFILFESPYNKTPAGSSSFTSAATSRPNTSNTFRLTQSRYAKCVCVVSFCNTLIPQPPACLHSSLRRAGFSQREKGRKERRFNKVPLPLGEGFPARGGCACGARVRTFEYERKQNSA